MAEEVTEKESKKSICQETGNDTKIAESKPLASLQPDISTPYIAADVVLSASTDAAAACQNHGRVNTLDSPDPSKCVSTGSGTQAAMAEEKAKDVMSLSLEVELVSEITGSNVVGSIEQSRAEARGSM